jgi:hypothetical protein
MSDPTPTEPGMPAQPAPRAAASQDSTERPPDWLIGPSELPSHVRLVFRGALAASEIKPEILHALARIAEAIQRGAGTRPPVEICKKLQECGTYKDPGGKGCPNLVKCGTYSDAPPTPGPDDPI